MSSCHIKVDGIACFFLAERSGKTESKHPSEDSAVGKPKKKRKDKEKGDFHEEGSQEEKKAESSEAAETGALTEKLRKHEKTNTSIEKDKGGEQVSRSSTRIGME